jgi:hypothetical protein
LIPVKKDYRARSSIYDPRISILTTQNCSRPTADYGIRSGLSSQFSNAMKSQKTDKIHGVSH